MPSCEHCRFSPRLPENDLMACQASRELAGLKSKCVNGSGFMPVGALSCDNCGYFNNGHPGRCKSCVVMDRGVPTKWAPAGTVEAPSADAEEITSTNLFDIISSVMEAGDNPTEPCPTIDPGDTLDSIEEEPNVQPSTMQETQLVRTTKDKADDDKLEYSLIPQEIVYFMACVLTYGKTKYSANGWKTIKDPVRRYKDGRDRHMDAITLHGEDYDPESGLPHSVHALTNQMFLCWNDLKRLGHIKE